MAIQSFELIDTLGDLKKQFRENRNYLHQSLPAFLLDIQNAAFEVFSRLGIPDTKNENYRYTDLKPAFNKIYQLNTSSSHVNIEPDHIFNCDVPNLNTHVEFILNGRYMPKELDLTVLPNGIVYGSLLNACSEFPELVAKHIGSVANFKEDGLIALNAAFAVDGFFLYVPDNQAIDGALQLINLLNHHQNLLVNTRNLIILGKNSAAQVLMCDHTLADFSFLTNSVTEVILGENASFHLTKMQNENNQSTQLDGIFIHQERNSQATSNAISLHGGLIRNHFHVKLAGEGCYNETSGLYLTDRNQQITNHTLVEHLKPNCISSQKFKGVLDDEASGAFNGKIHVYPDAQKTEAYQVNRTILLTDQARMNSKPMLEIYADDVKCSHGATIGQLDEEALFYLQSRGIGRKEARLMLMYAFTDEIISSIRIPGLRERVEDLVNKRLRGELSRCNQCNFNCN
jgi:Fe-S cluster assembly protein SufD